MWTTPYTQAPTSTPTPEALDCLIRPTTPAAAPPGWSTHGDDAGSVKIALPSSWETFEPALLSNDAQRLSNMIGALEEAKYPDLTRSDFVMETVTLGAKNTPPVLFGADITANAARHHVPTTLVVTSRPRDGMSCDDNALQAALQVAATTTAADVHDVTVGGHMAAEVHADYPFSNPAPGGPAAMEVVVYALIEVAPVGDRHWLITFITTPDQVAGYLPTLRQIVATFAVTR